MSRLQNREAQELAELAARLAEGARLGRGRSYQRKGLVDHLDVEVGLVTASVRGSRAHPYEVSIACRSANENDRVAVSRDISAAAPGPMEMAFTCVCPDWGDPCKHGVAVLLEFAREVDDDAALLLKWRGLEDLTPPPPEGTESLIPSTPGPPEAARSVPKDRSSTAAQATSVTDAAESNTELDAFFQGAMPSDGGTLVGPLDEVQLDAYRRAHIMLETLDAAPVLDSALEAIAEHWLNR